MHLNDWVKIYYHQCVAIKTKTTCVLLTNAVHNVNYKFFQFTLKGSTRPDLNLLTEDGVSPVPSTLLLILKQTQLFVSCKEQFCA